MSQSGEKHYLEYQEHLAAGRLQNAGLSLMVAAISGYAPAQADLGAKYLRGELMPRDDEQALRWLTAAAGQEGPEAETARDLLKELKEKGIVG